MFKCLTHFGAPNLGARGRLPPCPRATPLHSVPAYLLPFNCPSLIPSASSSVSSVCLILSVSQSLCLHLSCVNVYFSQLICMSLSSFTVGQFPCKSISFSVYLMLLHPCSSIRLSAVSLSSSV